MRTGSHFGSHFLQKVRTNLWMKNMRNWEERVIWAIDVIKNDRNIGKGISNEELAKALGVNVKTLSAYKEGRGLLKGSVLEGLVTKFSFNSTWLIEGRSEPFPGARAKYPDVCGAEYDDSSGREVLPKVAGGEEMPAFRISEAITSAVKILESDTPYATALYLNIKAFERGLQAEQRIYHVEKRLAETEKEFLDRENKLRLDFKKITEDLIHRIRVLEKRNSELESITNETAPKGTLGGKKLDSEEEEH